MAEFLVGLAIIAICIVIIGVLIHEDDEKDAGDERGE